eukprot:CAMPEP_0171347034 /NCGR_PEP_ID=MMETSP0878-20121228/26755_1 /TAXON_ID=67004 /ORGANISM="Thalassiosira weissflogii, Strain CCMP1336" /LENGTH=327 /DNA_ID=CAMNT_0011850945 /DNA_START=161 /DNA_END=1144 /DNA_ORIENTATION=+
MNKLYDNSKQIRRMESSSVYEQALTKSRSPAEIISSFYKDSSWPLIRELIFSFLIFFIGSYVPKNVILPITGVNQRPIPYQVTQAGDVILDLTLANQLVSSADVVFPSSKLWFIALWVPIIFIFFVGSMFPLVISSFPNNSSFHNVHAGFCSVLVAIGISEFFTHTFKFYVGRLRPNFYAMCGFDTDTLSCQNGEQMENEARMSFPSGHSSLSCCGMMTLTLFLYARVGLGRIMVPGVASGRSKFLGIVAFTPLLVSFWCATSRLVDNWHHPSDIIAGTILGAVSAFISYHLWFPHMFSEYAGIPLSVIRGGYAEESESSEYLMVDV